MTALGPPRPAPGPALRARAAQDGRSSPAWKMISRLSGLRAQLGLAFGAGRPLDARNLTDRQLADIGLTRSDLPDGRGWRR